MHTHPRALESRKWIFATGALFAALALVALLPWVMPLDELVFQWIQFHRTCRVEGAFRWVDPVVRGSLAALIACALLRDGWRDPWYIAGLVLLFVGGAAAVELLKTAVERLRPNAIAGMISGNSFPSGHTTGAAMAAAIAVLMVHRWDWPCRACAPRATRARPSRASRRTRWTRGAMRSRLF